MKSILLISTFTFFSIQSIMAQSSFYEGGWFRVDEFGLTAGTNVYNVKLLDQFGFEDTVYDRSQQVYFAALHFKSMKTLKNYGGSEATMSFIFDFGGGRYKGKDSPFDETETKMSFVQGNFDLLGEFYLSGRDVPSFYFSAGAGSSVCFARMDYGPFTIGPQLIAGRRFLISDQMFSVSTKFFYAANPSDARKPSAGGQNMIRLQDRKYQWCVTLALVLNS